MSLRANSQYAFTSALQPTKQAWQQAATSALAVSGLSVSLASPLLLVSLLGDGVSQREIAEKIGVHPGALVRTLDKAEQSELLERRSIPGNRRAQGIYLLPKGRQLAVKMEGAMEALRTRLLKGIPKDELDIAIRSLRTFEENARGFVDEERNKFK